VATKPDVVIETGVARGGSVLFMASMLEAHRQGQGDRCRHWHFAPTTGSVPQGCYLVVADTVLGHLDCDQTPRNRSKMCFRGNEPLSAGGVSQRDRSVWDRPGGQWKADSVEFTGRLLAVPKRSLAVPLARCTWSRATG